MPAVLLQPTPAAILPVNATWRDVALYAASQRSAVGQCNFDKAQVKQWSDSQTAMEAE